MEKVTIKAYAVKHKLSIFDVMKKVRSHKLKSETVQENDKDVIYIVMDDNEEIEENRVEFTEDQNEKSLKDEIKILNDEVKYLRKEIEALKKKL